MGLIKILNNRKKTTLVDTATTFAASLPGVALDHLATIESPEGYAVTRGSALLGNLTLSGAWGRKRDRTFILRELTTNSSWLDKYRANVEAFNSFQTPLYGGSVFLGKLAEYGNVSLEGVVNAAQAAGQGMFWLALASVITAPLLGYFNDKGRKRAHLPTSAEKAEAYKNMPPEVLPVLNYDVT